MGELLAIAALLMYSVNTLLTKTGSKYININLGYFVAVSVNILFSLFLLAIQSITRTDALSWHWPAFFYFVLGGIFTTYLGRSFYFEAVVRFGPAKASIFQLAAPLFTVLIAWIFLDERLNTTTLTGIFVTVTGLFLAVYVPGTFARNAAARAATPGGQRGGLAGLRWIITSSLYLGLGGALAYAIGNVWRGAAMRDWNEPVAGGLIGAAAGMLLYLGMTPKLRTLWQDLKAANPVGLRMFSFTGALNISAQILGIMSLHYISVSVSILIVSCVPILVIPMSYFLLKHREGISLRSIVGTLITIAGIAMILLGRD